jgi:hypothetical protein
MKPRALFLAAVMPSVVAASAACVGCGDSATTSGASSEAGADGAVRDATGGDVGSGDAGTSTLPCGPYLILGQDVFTCVGGPRLIP